MANIKFYSLSDSTKYDIPICSIALESYTSNNNGAIYNTIFKVAQKTKKISDIIDIPNLDWNNAPFLLANKKCFKYSNADRTIFLAILENKKIQWDVSGAITPISPANPPIVTNGSYDGDAYEIRISFTETFNITNSCSLLLPNNGISTNFDTAPINGTGSTAPVRYSASATLIGCIININNEQKYAYGVADIEKRIINTSNVLFGTYNGQSDNTPYGIKTKIESCTTNMDDIAINFKFEHTGNYKIKKANNKEWEIFNGQIVREMGNYVGTQIVYDNDIRLMYSTQNNQPIPDDPNFPDYPSEGDDDDDNDNDGGL